MLESLLALSQAKFGPTWGPALYELVTSLAFIVAILVPLMLSVAYLTLWERKLIGWMQIRIGPNRVTFFGISWLGGLAQPVADGIVSGPGSNNGARIASGAHPASIIHPDSVFCGNGRCHLRSSTVPSAQPIAAPRISRAAVGARWKCRMSSPSSSAIPSMPSAMPAIRRRPRGSESSTSENNTLHTGIVNARIALRPAGN